MPLSKIVHYLFSILIILVLAFSSCMREDHFPVGKVAFCDTEQLDSKKKRFVDSRDPSGRFDGGQHQSNLEAYSESHSAMTVAKKSPFALKYTIPGIGPDAFFKVSVWRKSKDGKGVLVASSKDAKLVYKAIDSALISEQNGWEKLELEVYTSPHFGYSELSFYVWNNGSDTVYFDDLKIERFEKKTYPTITDPPMVIMLDTSDYIKLMAKRKEAFELGVLQTADDDWVKGILLTDDHVLKARLRLKGDWLDHLAGDKWSYRIKMRKTFAWNRLRTFSIQTPSSRDFLREWEAHQFYRSKDILTTRYGFVPLIINTNSRGIYAWEEHFDKQLLEWSYRREGPILKFTEDAFWQMQRNNILKNDKWRSIPYYEASVIEPFKESKTLRTPALFKQFLNGQKLMYQYKFSQAKPADIFDVKKMAAYLAMLDLMKISHGKTWHNQRFYFNPVLCKLEPIAFDGYSDHSYFHPGIESSSAYLALNEKRKVYAEQGLVYTLFTDTTFVDYYLGYLEEFSEQEFVVTVKTEIYGELKHYDSLIAKEFQYYQYDPDFLVENAKEIRDYLPELKSLIENKLKAESFKFKIDKNVYDDTLVIKGTPELLVNSYVQQKSGDSLILRVDNFNPRDLYILGTGSKSKYVEFYFHPEPELAAYTGDENKTIEIKTDTNANFLFFMIKNRFQTYAVPIHKWPFPSGRTAQQELMDFAGLDDNPLIEEIKGEDIYIKTGGNQTNRPCIIPEGYRVNFMAGTQLDFIEGAMFISYSPVFINGTKNEPVIITSSDFSANGFTVLQAGEQSFLEHVVFENMNTLDYKGWTITGAVTFYESDVTISNTKFYRNQCEDALNTIRSEFTVINSEFEYIFGDAFDSDFCTGNVIDTRFSNIGNDAIDFSGSQISISGVLIEDTDDKGISGGEESTLKVENTTIRRAGIGLASKDLSVVEFNNGEIIDCTYGLVLLQKKAEYGPATVIINNTKIIKPETEMLIELGSKVIKDKLPIIGEKAKLADIFYQ